MNDFQIQQVALLHWLGDEEIEYITIEEEDEDEERHGSAGLFVSLFWSHSGSDKVRDIRNICQQEHPNLEEHHTFGYRQS